MARGGLGPEEKGSTNTWAAPLKTESAGAPVGQQTALWLLRHPEAGSIDHVISGCLVCKRRWLPAHTDSVWPEVALDVLLDYVSWAGS